MATEIHLVKVGMTMHEGTVEEWYVGDGERVETGALLYRLETEKVNLDVDAESAGVVKHLVAEGTTLEPGEVVGYIYADGEPIPDVLPKPGPKRDVAVLEEPSAPAKPAPNAERPRGKAGKRIAASPVARKLAAERGIDLATVVGTGPRGRITKEDVEQAAQPAARATASANAIPLRGMRKTIAERMFASLRDSAQLTMDMEVAMDDAVKLRQALVAEWEGDGVRVTYTDLVLVAVAKSLARHPAMNAALVDDAIVRFDHAHVGVAVALDDGLIVPVVKDAHEKSLQEVARASADLAARARQGVDRGLWNERVVRSRRAGAARGADGAGRGRWHFHRHLARHVRRRRLHADSQPAAGRHSRRRPHLRRRALGRRHAAAGSADAPVAHLGSPRPRRRTGSRVPRHGAQPSGVAVPPAGLIWRCARASRTSKYHVYLKYHFKFTRFF